MLPLIIALATAPIPMVRGEIFGDLRLGEKYLADVKLTLTCGAESVDGTTDKSGSFRLTVKGSGKCQLKVTYEKQTPSIDVVLFDQAARYRFQLEQADGKYVLKRVQRMADEEMTIVKDDKDRWDKLAIILAPVGGLLTALAVASLGIFGSRALDQRQSSEAKLRLYSELMSKREESEATLRKEMFQSIIGSFFDAQSTSLEAKLLKMELLAQNFHEALNLTPLFQHMRREISNAPVSPALQRQYEARLSELAREITRKQMIVLESGGERFDWTVLLSDSLIAGTKTETLEDVELTLDSIRRRFRVTLYQVDTVSREIRVGLEIETPPQPGVSPTESGRFSVEFMVGFFSTPMIDNTRLSNDQRVAMVLTNLNNAGAGLSLVYFPGSRASLREKPYYEEILRKLAGQ